MLASAIDGDITAQSAKSKRKENWTPSRGFGEQNISVIEFFTRLLNENNDLIKWDTSFENAELSSDSEEEKFDSNLHFSQMTEVLKCIICLDKPRDLQNRTANSLLLCPYCRQIVENHIKVFQ